MNKGGVSTATELFAMTGLYIVRQMYAWADEKGIDIGIETNIKGNSAIIHMRTKYTGKEIMKVVGIDMLKYAVDPVKFMEQILDEMLEKLNKESITAL